MALLNLAGGLRPIVSRLVLDVITLSGLLYACWTPSHHLFNTLVLVGTIVLTLATAGLTNRWTLSMPMIPIVILQVLRRFCASTNNSPNSFKWTNRFITAFSLAFVALSAILIVLFPAVELPPIHGPANVGVVDLFLPVEYSWDANRTTGNNHDNNQTCDVASTTRLSVRIWYPTLEEPDRIPYLRPDTAVEFCRQTMKFGAPGPLKQFGWMLHTWRLSKLRVKRNGALIPPSVSHGLGGNAELYSYQTMALAAHGNVVLSINHADGSAPVVQNYDGSFSLYDYDVGKLWAAGRRDDYVRLRRDRTDQRARELLAAVEAFLRLNEQDGLDGPGKTTNNNSNITVSFRSRLDTGRVTFMGHSFGGATALTVAKRRPDLVHAVIAHEPAVDWMPDDALGSLFTNRLLRDLQHHNFTGGTGGFIDPNVTNDDSLHGVDMLFLFSDEWRQKRWGFSHILEDLHRLGRLGKPGGSSNFGVIRGAHHTEFSDTCMITPLWLSRSTGVAGKRNPLHTASEIVERTLAFLHDVRRQS